MNKLIKKLNIDEYLTTPGKKQRKFNKIKNNIPLLEDLNFMVDLLFLPETKEGYKYLFVIVDLASDEFDMEPLRTKESSEVLEAYKKCLKRPHIGKRLGTSIRSDGGKEFMGNFDKYLYNEKIFHKKARPYRHKQMANVEALNKQLSRLINGYLNNIEIETNEIYNEWLDIIPLLRTELNKIRKKKLKDYIDPDDYKTFNVVKAKKPKFKIGDMVHYKLDYPENALGKMQPTANFRTADYRYSAIPKRIINEFYFSDYPYYRYQLKDMLNVSFSEHELKPALYDDEEKFKVKKIIGHKTINKKKYYLVWWQNYKKNESSYELETQLIEDGLIDIINEYKKSIKNKKK